MYINTVSHYLPEQRVTNAHFGALHEREEEWYLTRTGIHERSKASSVENSHTMGRAAVSQGLPHLPYPVEEIDLIVGATYTPYDSIVTLGHSIQNLIDVPDIPVVTISSACSSLINAIEIVEGYFAMGKASKALVVASEHNTAYARDDDRIAGHLWGDGASAMFLSKERVSEDDFFIRDIITKGAATVGKAMESVTLRPFDGGFAMPFGRDVFQYACLYMAQVTRDILERNDHHLDELDYLIPHQANMRIISNVAEQLDLMEHKALSNIHYLGNTGCAGCAITFSENRSTFKKGDIIVFTVFGGGYSYGAMLVEA